jgi:hypothetical protein
MIYRRFLHKLILLPKYLLFLNIVSQCKKVSDLMVVEIVILVLYLAASDLNPGETARIDPSQERGLDAIN